MGLQSEGPHCRLRVQKSEVKDSCQILTTKYLVISPRFAYQGRRGRQLRQTICYKQTEPAEPGVSQLSGTESHTLWQQ